MAKILVTGGAGFIGSNIALSLWRQGHEVSVLDDMSLGRPENLAESKGEIRIISGDASDASIADSAVNGVEQIYHLASASSAPMYEPDPRRANEATLTSFLNVLDAARRNSITGIVYASSSSIYGASHPPHSEDMPVRPVSFYTACKLAKEHYAEVYSRAFGMRIAAMRFFSVYGPHETHKGRFANVITQFLWLMKEGKAPTIYGDGTQTRDYVFVDDVVRCCTLAMERKADGVFNVGTGEARSFNDVVDELNSALGTSIRQKYVPNPIKNYVAHTLADTRKSEKELGFRARFSFMNGIRELVKYY